MANYLIQNKKSKLVIQRESILKLNEIFKIWIKKLKLIVFNIVVDFKRIDNSLMIFEVLNKKLKT